MKKAVIIFSDLDRSLLEAHTYSFDAAREALDAIRKRELPLVLVSSKTRGELLFWRSRLGTEAPFIAENGGGIFIPPEYFADMGEWESEWDAGFQLITLGGRYPELRKALGILKSRGFSVRGFGDMDVEEIGARTGLSVEQSYLAARREFDEPFILESGDETAVVKEIENLGFRHTKGEFHHLMGNSDKGKAVDILLELYRRKYGALISVGLGDSPNDVPMLEAVDIPVLVRLPDGKHHPEINLNNPHVVLSRGIGPEGWNEAVLDILARHLPSPEP